MRNTKGQFVKGEPSTTKGSLGKHWKNTAGTIQKRIKANVGKHFGHGAWNKGIKKATNTGKTHFKKGQVPHNYKGGISKTKEYRRYYHSRYKFRKRNCSGDHAFGDWEIMKAQYNWTCPCCHRSEPVIKLTEDHIIPLSKGGSNNIENIQPLCVSCNSKKHAKLIPKYED